MLNDDTLSRDMDSSGTFPQNVSHVEGNIIT